MTHLIDKDALVAELKKRFDYRVNGLKAINNGTFWDEEQSEDTFNVALTKCAYNAVKNELFELKCFLDIVETIEAITVETVVEMDAGGYPYIPQIELYDYEKDVPLAKAGDEVKVIIIIK